jgi:hypothetical protein
MRAPMSVARRLADMEPNPSIEGTCNIRLRLLLPAPHVKRVCRAWHESRRVKVLAPGISRAEG